jgi:hypothetical protein
LPGECVASEVPPALVLLTVQHRQRVVVVAVVVGVVVVFVFHSATLHNATVCPGNLPASSPALGFLVAPPTRPTRNVTHGYEATHEGYKRPPPVAAHPGLRTHIHTHLYHVLLSDLEPTCRYFEVNAYIRSLFPFNPTQQSFQAS